MAFAIHPNWFPVGIDIGTKRVYIAVARENNLFNGSASIEILPDNYSRRQIMNSLYIHNGMRDIGVLSTSLLSHILSSVYYYYQFLGKTASVLKDHDLMMYPYLDIGNGKEELRVALAPDRSKRIYLEHCLAMMIDHCSSLVQQTARAPPFYVFSIPSYATVSFRSNFDLAVQISSIKDYCTLHAQLAVVLDFAYYRNLDKHFSSYSPESPFVLGIINSGFHSTECSLFRIWANHIELAGFSYREFCGGDRVTWVLVAMIQELCEKENRHYQTENPRSCFELYCIAEKAKHDILLENVDELQLELYDDKDSECIITLNRRSVEQRIQQDGVVSEILTAFMECLQQSGCREITRCELVGGSGRLSVLKEQLQTTLAAQGIPCAFSATLNCDECIANGCELYAIYKTNPADCTQPELMACIDRINVDYVPSNGIDPFCKQSEAIIEECRRNEQEMAFRHQEYQEMSSLHNSTDGSYFRLKHLIEEKPLSSEVKAEVEELLLKARQLQVWNTTRKSILYGQWLKAVMDYLCNKIDETAERLTLFTVENGEKRCIVEGTYFRGEVNGEGTFFDYDPSQGGVRFYTGQWKGGKWEGEGRYVEKNAMGLMRWEGEFRDCELWNGRRIDELSSGVMIVTAICNGFKESSYVYDQQNALLYVGGIRRYLKNGWGTEFYSQEQLPSYSGYFVDGRREGKGCCYYRSGKLKYRGEWKDNMFNGFGTEYDQEGTLKAQGTFVNGSLQRL